MKKSNKFCIICIAFVAALVLFNGIVWHGFTKQLLTHKDGLIVGDLARMGYLHGHAHLRRNQIDLPKRHLEAKDLDDQRVDMITIGDSFSNGGGSGKNRFYQDYIATYNDINVLNLQTYDGGKNFLQGIVILLNSGYLDELAPRYILLEMVERSCVTRLVKPIDFAATDSIDKVRNFYQGDRATLNDTIQLPSLSFFNTGNLKALLYNLGYLFSDNAITSKVYRVPLKQALFSGKHGDDLLFLYKDLDKLKYATPDVAQKLNNNLNQVARLLKEHGIELIFMPPPNKYTLYQRFLTDDSYPQGRFFEYLEPLPKEYQFINAKEILDRALKRGEKDLFFLDDTHWSWKASQIIFDQTRFP
jgi:hypothetical protein